jgi:hypothetical protein
MFPGKLVSGFAPHGCPGAIWLQVLANLMMIMGTIMGGLMIGAFGNLMTRARCAAAAPAACVLAENPLCPSPCCLFTVSIALLLPIPCSRWHRPSSSLSYLLPVCFSCRLLPAFLLLPVPVL